MKSKNLILGLLVSTALVPAAFAAESNPSASTPAASAKSTVTPLNEASANADWRASKLVGVNVYNDQNEKLGAINDVLITRDGKVAGVVIAVGGFLGMGEHDVLVGMDKLKFSDEPVRTASTSTSTTGAPRSTTTAPTKAASSGKKWYPDHAVLSASKDQLKAVPEFKY
jgi:sporulation protein YlmC with PRC-barrel domain